MFRKIITTFLPQIVLAFVGLVLIAIFLPMFGPTRTTASDSNTISVVCQGSNNRGLLIAHQFPSRDACLQCKDDPNCGPQLVGQPSDHNVCPAGNNYLGTTTNPRDGLPTTCSDVGSCGGSCSSPVPNCAVVQLDCLNGLGGGINAGNLTFFCDCPPPPPPQAHNECQNFACVVVTGAGSNQCQTPANPSGECSHLTCQNNACVRVSGGGTDNCPNNCQPQTHRECQNFACAVVSGAGDNQCQTVTTGPSNECSHLTCQNSACTRVSGGGTDSCPNNCQSPQQVVCDSLSLSPNSGTAPLTTTANLSGHTVNGGNIANYRFNFGDGTGDFTQGSGSLNHTFNGIGTFTVTGIVVDNLGNSAGGTGTCAQTVMVNQAQHRACINMACQMVSGGGNDSCSTDSQCFHLACQGNSCMRVAGGGDNSCSSDSNCVTASQQPVCDSLSVSPSSGNTPLGVSVSLSGHTINGGSIVSYRFNFGDGSADQVQNGQTTAHTFTNAGTFVITGFVLDNLGNTAGGTIACQKVVTASTPAVLGVATPPVIPRTGAETGVLAGLFGSGAFGWAIKKFFGNFKKD